jgi:voltage-gated potassium channel
MMAVDLLAILPAYLPFLGMDLRFVRAFRLMRIFRILKVARYSSAIQVLARVFATRRADLTLTGAAIGIVLLISSSILFFVEQSAEPATFDSIPEAMWWAVVTLTTVGYGDLYPVTGLGRLLGGVVALVGICVIAIPTGIIGAGFAEELRWRSGDGSCPSCGRPGPAENSGSVTGAGETDGATRPGDRAGA